ncbi:MAG: hypothetical protein ACRDH7_07925 [Actinomycetota bacterium]
MSATPDPAASKKRRSFLVLVATLIVGVAVVVVILGRGDDAAVSNTPTPGASGSSAAGAVTLQTACAEIAPDMAFRVDALRRTASLVRADVATMQQAGNTADAAQATKIADALDAAAAAENSQKGVRRATRELGQTLASIC